MRSGQIQISQNNGHNTLNSNHVSCRLIVLLQYQMGVKLGELDFTGLPTSLLHRLVVVQPIYDILSVFMG